MEVKVTKEMVYAFCNAVSDASITEQEFNEVEIGLKSALCNLCVPADKPSVAVPDDVYEALANELWELGLDTKPGYAPQLGEVYEILDKHLAIAPSHSQQSARITSADQFIDGRYYWCKFTNRNAVSYGDTVIWQFTQSRRDAPYLAHHPVDAELFAKAEIYGPVPMPELSREHCPSHESEQGGAV